MTQSKVEPAIGELIDFPIFNGFSRSQVLDLCTGGELIFSPHREQAFRFGEVAEYFGIVFSGAYKLSKPSPLGENVIVHFSTPGDVIAAFIMAQPRPIFPVSATAMGPSRFLKLPRSVYIEKWKGNLELILRVQNLLSTRMTLIQDQMVMAKAPLNQKVASLLLILLERSPVENGMELPLPLTRKEIADTLGASVESVIRIMSEWSKMGIIQTNDQYIRVTRPDKVIDFLKN